MRRAICWIAVGLLLVACGDAALAARSKKKRRWRDHPLVVPFTKITRGATNIVKAPLDIPATAFDAAAKSKTLIGALAGFTAGAVEGVANGAARAVAGIGEAASFPLVHQKKAYYNKPLGHSPFRSKKKTKRGGRRR